MYTRCIGLLDQILLDAENLQESRRTLPQRTRTWRMPTVVRPQHQAGPMTVEYSSFSISGRGSWVNSSDDGLNLDDYLDDDLHLDDDHGSPARKNSQL